MSRHRSTPTNAQVRRLMQGFVTASDGDVARAAATATRITHSLRSVGKVARGRPAPFTFVLNEVARALRAAVPSTEAPE